MISVESSVEIQRTSAEVFAFVSDQTNSPRWQRGLAEVRRTTAGPPGVGTEHIFTRRFAGHALSARNKYTAFEEGSGFTFEIPDGWLSGSVSQKIEPTGKASSRLITSMRLNPSGPAALGSALLAHILTRDVRRDQATLKALLERPGGWTPTPA